MVDLVTGPSIYEAWTRIHGHVRYTPLFRASHFLEPLPSPCDLFFKLEQHQVTGSFKFRGVTHKILQTDKERLKRGIYAASGGNHGRAVAYAGMTLGVRTTVILPVNTASTKIELIRKFKAEIIQTGKDLVEASQIAKDLAEKNEALFIHPFADVDIIKGQGTIGVEVLQQCHDIDTIVLAVGGGGLLAGVGTYVKSVNPDIRIIGVQPEGCPSMYDSLKAGHIVSENTITTKVGTLAIPITHPINYNLTKECVDDIILVSDEEMLQASSRLWNEFGIAGELSGSASFAALLSGRIRTDPGEKVCVVISGLGSDGVI